ncbi:molecular chaperone DnaJ [Natronomonas pharaonis DSM 2160]|uniref:Chaperone protein DnaJ n=1 Tax=Natronomonas pharaonis (strain ATCC 35678 / DSM 2160 / CIP 103997 / JCM 8858 / NBRC 14720 / NCIMB 2260 / Gabara) TaxID=348780 RepID=DNAJ_NATPD|nr:molecular chaperone DnaJ [Natronomonas pharaonis]Q3IUB7.1 RecName: Full=Chaperone protein DnaJ [Natronomonas pharaonis DSM 2160]CAI48264.1 molecular chaperone DnaJ [Natronomonas pharaonis DSM 2160]
MSEDFYSVLGVSRDADEDEIKQAYRKKASEYHPDVSDDPNAEEKFKQVKKAKEVLLDDEKRRMYDQMGHERFQEAEKRGATDTDRGRGGMGGMGGGGMGGMNDIFEQFFGGGGRSQSRSGPRQGSDLKTRLKVDLEDAYHGVTKQLTVTRPEECPDCDGAGHPPDADSRTCSACDGRGQQTTVRQTALGRVQQTRECPQCDGKGTIYSETCSTCRGDGQVRNETTLQVEVPAGIRDGQTLRMDGEGAPGENGGRKGDLLVEIRIDDHETFERDGDDLRCRHPISFPQAVFGDTVEVPTLDGAVEMDVPAGTQSGETFRLRGKGMPRLKRRGHGDLYVQVRVVTPESLNEEQREALEAFAEAGGEEIDVEQGFFEKLKSSF